MTRDIPSTTQIVQDILRVSEACGVSVSRIFRRADMPVTTFTNWRDGVCNPSLQSIQKIYAALSEFEGEQAAEAAGARA